MEKWKKLEHEDLKKVRGGLTLIEALETPVGGALLKIVEHNPNAVHTIGHMLEGLSKSVFEDG